MSLTKVTYPMIDAQSDEINTIYVATTGSDSNNGLSPSSPKLTLQAAIDALSEMTAYLSGTWVIQLAAGTYARGRFPDNGIASQNPIQIKGADVGGYPNVPTTIISEGANGITGDGIRLTGSNTKVQCQDLKVVGYNGTSASTGISASYYSELYCINCHVTNCTWGISATQHCFLDVKGGVLDGCGFNSSGVAYSSGGGVRGLFLTKFSLGNPSATDLTEGPVFRNNSFGIFAQEHIDGHADWCTFEDNDTHIRLNICSRLNLNGSSFKRSAGAAIWAQENSVISIFANNVFGTGADANHINVICNTGAVCNPRSLLTNTTAYSMSSLCFARGLVNETIASTVFVEIIDTTLKAQLWRDALSSVSGIKKFRVKLFGTLTGTAGFKRPEIKFGSTNINVTFTSAETGHFICEGEIYIGGDPVGTQQLTLSGYTNLGTTTRFNLVTASEALTSDTSLRVGGYVENVADSIVVKGYEIYVDGL